MLQHFLAGLLAALLTAAPASAPMDMDCAVGDLALTPQGGCCLDARDLEDCLGLGKGELLALRVLTLPQGGRLYAGGVAVEPGETLLRRDLAQLSYVSESPGEDDWFSLLPCCPSRRLCAVLNLRAAENEN